MELLFYRDAIGWIKLCGDAEAVTAVRLLGKAPTEEVSDGASDGEEAEQRVLRGAQKEIEEYFSGQRKAFTFPFRVAGTPFQQRVWAALCEIPYGETRSYGEIAAAIGNPRACRAVGMANNANRLTLRVPCHRVIGADGSLTGFGSGLEIKAKLLELEAGEK